MRCQNEYLYGCKDSEAEEVFVYGKKYIFCLYCKRMFTNKMENDKWFRAKLIAEYNTNESQRRPDERR